MPEIKEADAGQIIPLVETPEGEEITETEDDWTGDLAVSLQVEIGGVMLQQALQWKKLCADLPAEPMRAGEAQIEAIGAELEQHDARVADLTASRAKAQKELDALDERMTSMLLANPPKVPAAKDSAHSATLAMQITVSTEELERLKEQRRDPAQRMERAKKDLISASRFYQEQCAAIGSFLVAGLIEAARFMTRMTKCGPVPLSESAVLSLIQSHADTYFPKADIPTDIQRHAYGLITERLDRPAVRALGISVPIVVDQAIQVMQKTVIKRLEGIENEQQ